MPAVDTTLPPSVTNNIPLLNIKVNNTTNFLCLVKKKKKKKIKS
jgi:hypothetical protein